MYGPSCSKASRPDRWPGRSLSRHSVVLGQLLPEFREERRRKRFLVGVYSFLESWEVPRLGSSRYSSSPPSGKEIPSRYLTEVPQNLDSRSVFSGGPWLWRCLWSNSDS